MGRELYVLCVQRPAQCEGRTPLPLARVWPRRPLNARSFSRSQFSTVQTTQELFGPAGLAFMKMAAHMDHVGQPMKLLYGVNGRGGEANEMASAPEPDAVIFTCCRSFRNPEQSSDCFACGSRQG